MPQIPRPGRRNSRCHFLAYFGASVAGIAMLGCTGKHAPGTIGQRVEQGGAAVLVKGAVRRTVFSQHFATTHAQPDQTFVLVRMIVENISAPRFENPPEAFTLTSSEGRTFRPLDVGFHIPAPSHTALLPGGRSNEPVVFEVPSASGSLILSFQPAGIAEIRFELPPPAELPAEPDA